MWLTRTLMLILSTFYFTHYTMLLAPSCRGHEWTPKGEMRIVSVTSGARPEEVDHGWEAD